MPSVEYLKLTASLVAANERMNRRENVWLGFVWVRSVRVVGIFEINSQELFQFGFEKGPWKKGKT